MPKSGGERRSTCGEKAGEGFSVRNVGLMVKCTPERGHNALFFIPLEVFIML